MADSPNDERGLTVANDSLATESRFSGVVRNGGLNGREGSTATVAYRGSRATICWRLCDLTGVRRWLRPAPARQLRVLGGF